MPPGVGYGRKRLGGIIPGQVRDMAASSVPPASEESKALGGANVGAEEVASAAPSVPLVPGMTIEEEIAIRPNAVGNALIMANPGGAIVSNPLLASGGTFLGQGVQNAFRRRRV